MSCKAPLTEWNISVSMIYREQRAVAPRVSYTSNISLDHSCLFSIKLVLSIYGLYVTTSSFICSTLSTPTSASFMIQVNLFFCFKDDLFKYLCIINTCACPSFSVQLMPIKRRKMTKNAEKQSKKHERELKASTWRESPKNIQDPNNILMTYWWAHWYEHCCEVVILPHMRPGIRVHADMTALPVGSAKGS